MNLKKQDAGQWNEKKKMVLNAMKKTSFNLNAVFLECCVVHETPQKARDESDKQWNVKNGFLRLWKDFFIFTVAVVTDKNRKA